MAPVDAVPGHIDDVAALAQTLLQVPRQLGVVFDDKDAHPARSPIHRPAASGRHDQFVMQPSAPGAVELPIVLHMKRSSFHRREEHGARRFSAKGHDYVDAPGRPCRDSGNGRVPGAGLALLHRATSSIGKARFRRMATAPGLAASRAERCLHMPTHDQSVMKRPALRRGRRSKVRKTLCRPVDADEA